MSCFNALGPIENKAIDIINNLPLFTWEVFEKHYFTNKGARNTLNFAFTEYANKLRAAG